MKGFPETPDDYADLLRQRRGASNGSRISPKKPSKELLDRAVGNQARTPSPQMAAYIGDILVVRGAELHRPGIRGRVGRLGSSILDKIYGHLWPEDLEERSRHRDTSAPATREAIYLKEEV